MLARCWRRGMATLYIRDVPEEDAVSLRRLAQVDGKSVSAFVGEELERLVNRAGNSAVVAELRADDWTGGPTAEDVLRAIHEARR